MTGLSLGPVGTKLGTFIINEQLEIINDHFSITLYDKKLKDSIDIGLIWLKKNIPILSSLAHNLQEKELNKYKKILERLEDQFTLSGYRESINQKIIEFSHDILSRINSVETPPTTRKIVNSNFKIKPDNHLGAISLDKISLSDINTHEYLLVETTPGNFILCLYVKHNDHWDILPYNYLIEKVKDLSITI